MTFCSRLFKSFWLDRKIKRWWCWFPTLRKEECLLYISHLFSFFCPIYTVFIYSFWRKWMFFLLIVCLISIGYQMFWLADSKFSRHREIERETTVLSVVQISRLSVVMGLSDTVASDALRHTPNIFSFFLRILDELKEKEVRVFFIILLR